MPHGFRLTPLAALLLTGLLTACSADPGPDAAGNAAAQSEPALNTPQYPQLQAWTPASARGAESWRLLEHDQLLAADAEGIWLLDAEGQPLARHPGNFHTLDARRHGQQLLIASTADQQPTLLLADAHSLQVHQQLALPVSSYRIESLCLYQDDSANLHLFLIGEEGMGDQWLVASPDGLLPDAAHVRSLRLPPESEHCAVDEQQHVLYVSEEGVGIWAYGAQPEAEQSRRPVDMVAPFGQLQEMVAGLAVLPGGLLALDADARQLHAYQLTDDGWHGLAPQPLPGTSEPERLTARIDERQTRAELLLVDGDDGRLYQTRIDWTPGARPPAAELPIVLPTVQTEPVPSAGDAADDPAIWLHPSDPAQSRVLGTDKRNGLAVYDLQGRQLQYLASGRLNNVDVRHGFQLGEALVDLAVASNRDHNSLHAFVIDPASGKVSELGQIATDLDEIYGLCLGRNRDGALYAIANDKDGRFVQYRLDASQGELSGQLVREFAIASQPEGCVVDDQRQRLFIGEEGEAVWALDAGANGSTEMTRVISVGGPIEADIEGLAIYQHPEHPWLVISSQGNDSYVVVDAEPPYQLRGSFRIVLNSTLGIDGVAETDGLEVTSANLGGQWSQGMLMVQDGRKRLPEGNQNYKYVPWQSIADALQLD